jgi:hypothetical protein
VDHVTGGRLAAEEGPLQVDPDHPVELLLTEVERPRRRKARGGSVLDPARPRVLPKGCGSHPATGAIDVSPPWRLTGEYLENCNCAVLCPCLVGPRSERGGALARPTEGHCDVPVVFQVERGTHGDVSLDGLAAAVVIHTPGPMGEGRWTVGLYLDERATPPQQAALEAIFGGAAGGPLGVLGALAETRLPTRTAAIRFEQDGTRRRASIPGVLELEIEGLPGRDRASAMWVDNVRHFAAGRLALALATRSMYRDHGLGWDHTSRNAHYAPISWSGP